MIVECTHCGTKFNLPDDKVKSEGVKIRCTRCKNVFEVLPSKKSPDLTDSLSAGPEDDLSGFDVDKTNLSVEGTGESDFGTDTDQDLGEEDFNLDAGDSDFDLGSDLDADSAEQEGKTQTDSLEFDLDKEVQEVSDEGGSLQFDLDEKSGTPARGGAPPDKGLDGDLGDLDISFNEAPETTSAPAASDTTGDIDLSVFAEEKPQPAGRGPAPAAGPRPVTAKGVGDDFAIGGGDLLGAKGGDFGFGDSVDIGLGNGALGNIEEPTPAFRPRKKAARRSPLLVALLIILFLAAAGYWGYTTYFAKGFDPAQLLSLFSGNEDPLAGFENVENKMQYYYVNNAQAGRIFVLDGMIINHAEVPKGRIKVRVTFYDKSGKELGKSESYCGNIIEVEELETLGQKEMTELLLVPTGKKFDNALIKPKGSIPYMLVVFTVPTQTDGYDVTVVEAQVVGK